MKRFILSVALVELLITLLMTTILGVGDFTVYASNETVIHGTAEVTIDVKLENNPGFASTGFGIEYDANVLVYKGFTAGSIFTSSQIEVNGEESGILIVSILDSKSIKLLL